jgi:NAD(P)-dependent dehydrogenase (short-subunit alcohol dehydrogenase family)
MRIREQQRFGELEEVADAIIFLASDSVRYITGAEIRVYGCLSMYARRRGD